MPIDQYTGSKLIVEKKGSSAAMRGNKRATRKGYEPHRVGDPAVPRGRPKKERKGIDKKNIKIKKPKR